MKRAIEILLKIKNGGDVQICTQRDIRFFGGLVEKLILTSIQMCRSCHVPFLSLRKKIQTKSAFNYACVSRCSEGHLDKWFKYSANI